MSTDVFLRILQNFQEHLRVAAWFFTISRVISHYAFFSVRLFNKTLLMRYSETYLPCQWQNKNENKLDQEMILVDNLDPSTSFCNKRKEKVFQNCSGETILLNCTANICSAKTFLKLSEETTSVEIFTNFTGKHLCWSLPLINPEGLFILSLIFKTLTA